MLHQATFVAAHLAQPKVGNAYFMYVILKTEAEKAC